MQPVVVIPHRRFGTTYLSHLPLTLEDGADWLSQNVVSNYHGTLRNSPEEHRSHLFRGGRLKLHVKSLWFRPYTRNAFLQMNVEWRCKSFILQFTHFFKTTTSLMALTSVVQTNQIMVGVLWVYRQGWHVVFIARCASVHRQYLGVYVQNLLFFSVRRLSYIGTDKNRYFTSRDWGWMQPIFEDPSISLYFRTLQILLINLVPPQTVVVFVVRPPWRVMRPFVFAVAV